MSPLLNEPPHPFSLSAARARRVHVPCATEGLGLVMQAGVETACTTGIPFLRLLREELAIPPAKLSQIDVFLLNGKPVDTPDNTPVWSGSRIALAAGLPGIAGLAMKSGSAVRALRPGITHGDGETNTARIPGPGAIEVALFSLALPLLAPHFLKRGVLLVKEKLLPHVRPAIAKEWLFHERVLDCACFTGELASLPDGTPFLLTAVIT